MSKITLPELPTQYQHRDPERRWSAYWEERGFFHSDPDPRRKPFTIVIPPPNVTGALHLGHALNNSLQDILVRFHRMRGFNALWMPGTDHAGIATQAVVEKRLLEEEKQSRHDLGRARLVERIWAWKEEYEERIIHQLRRMGCSCDWRRLRFTLDPVCARAVRHTFYRMFATGLIYRGKRLVNWDTFLQTAVSDDEVFHETVAGSFWHIRYPIVDPRQGDPTHVIVATTRPETILGDTAVAVHPDPQQALAEAEAELIARMVAAGEKQMPELKAQLAELARRRELLLPGLIRLRDMALAGYCVRLPLAGREIPLVADPWARPDLGSGCVKITPAHDPNDYDVGLRRKLPMVNILRPDGTLNENAGAYQGLTVAKARQRVVADLEAQGLLDHVEDREIDLAHSDRSKTPIEPYLADQWFVKMNDLAQSAMDAVTTGRVKVFPPRYARGYLDWLAEKRDWPISRQLWWGHQIPIWFCRTATETELDSAFAGRQDVAWQRDHEQQQWLICALEEDLPEDAVPGHRLVREVDVLDTWFSSALWPHSTLGWPEPTPELAYYYPTSTLVTSRDIITLWVARMVLTGLFNMGDVPFHQVFIHPKILDGYGETMSKSKGNGVDPIDVMDKFGADALRFGLAFLTTETQDVRMTVDFECPNCQHHLEQTKKNRVLPRIECPKCKRPFSTQWAKSPADEALPRGAVVSERFELARNFCNKLWNAARFTLLNLEGFEPATLARGDLAVEDRWIQSRLSTVTAEVTDSLASYRFGDATRVLYGFAWDEFCSFYLEMVKSRLLDPERRQTAQNVLAATLDHLLRLLHPAIPFVTEEIWQLLGQAAPQRGIFEIQSTASSLAVAAWPSIELALRDVEIEEQFRLFQEVLKALREIRSRQNIAPKTVISFVLRCSAATADKLAPLAGYFSSMAAAQAAGLGPDVIVPTPSAQAVVPAGELFVDLSEFIDEAAEVARHEKEREKLVDFARAKEEKLANPQFLARAPAEIVAKEQATLAEARQRLATIDEALAELRSRKK